LHLRGELLQLLQSPEKDKGYAREESRRASFTRYPTVKMEVSW
jgi:hypothetical protein